jgi:hypothetical protein
MRVQCIHAAAACLSWVACLIEALPEVGLRVPAETKLKHRFSLTEETLDKTAGMARRSLKGQNERVPNGEVNHVSEAH